MLGRTARLANGAHSLAVAAAESHFGSAFPPAGGAASARGWPTRTLGAARAAAGARLARASSVAFSSLEAQVSPLGFRNLMWLNLNRRGHNTQSAV
jgi:hypothetical protein